MAAIDLDRVVRDFSSEDFEPGEIPDDAEKLLSGAVRKLMRDMIAVQASYSVDAMRRGKIMGLDGMEDDIGDVTFCVDLNQDEEYPAETSAKAAVYEDYNVYVTFNIFDLISRNIKTGNLDMPHDELIDQMISRLLAIKEGASHV